MDNDQCGSRFRQVMETKDMLYLVSEYAKQGEIFGKSPNSFLSSKNSQSKRRVIYPVLYNFETELRPKSWPHLLGLVKEKSKGVRVRMRVKRL